MPNQQLRLRGAELHPGQRCVRGLTAAPTDGVTELMEVDGLTELMEVDLNY